MTIQGAAGPNPGFVSIGNPVAPIFQLSIGDAIAPDGGIYAQGARFGGVALPNGLTNTRLLWYPKKGAFRAGMTDFGITTWDDINIGEFSAAVGWNTTASGRASISSGTNSIASGENSVSLGAETKATGDCSVALGHLCEANGQYSGSMGWKAFANSTASIALGAWVQTAPAAYGAVVIGNGDFNNGGFCPLINSIPQSLMVGFSSTIPTFFVGPSSGSGSPCGTAAPTTGNVGISTSTPNNALEVNSPDPLPTTTLGGRSGLTFTDLNTTSTPLPNPGLGVLAANSSGDVIYVENTGLGNYCGATPGNPLTADYEIPLHNHDYYFSGQVVGKSNVLVGAPCAPNPAPYAKFQSYQLTGQPGYFKSFAGLFYNGTDDKLAVGVVGSSDVSTNVNIGVFGTTRQYAGVSNIGVMGTTNVAGAFLGPGTNIGTYGFSQAPAVAGFVNYGVVGDLGILTPPFPPPCIPFPLPCPPVTGPDAAGYFNGDMVSTTSYYSLSDGSFKENVQDIINPMDIINQINPKSYNFKHDLYPSMLMPTGTHYGFFSQDVQNVLPGLVKDCIHPARQDSLGNETHAKIDYKAINYTELIPFLIAGMKQQQQTIEAMSAQIAALNGGGNRHRNPDEGDGEEEGNSSSIEVELKNAKAIILNQNVPNPFAEQTTITFFLTDDVKKAQIFFYDNKGTILKTVDINEKGAGLINVFASDLSSGNYTYSLIADGKLIETKKMVKTN